MECTDATSFHQNGDFKPEDIMDTCRLCMARNVEMNFIFDEECDSVVDKVQFCTGIQIAQDDGLPNQICNACIKNLTVAHKFKTSCLHTEQKFRNILLNSIKEEPDVDFGDVLQYDDDEMEVKDEVLEKVLNENVRKTRTKLKKVKTESTVVENIQRTQKKRGPYKKSAKPQRIKKYKFARLHCETCDIRFKNKSESDDHKKTVHKDESWVCEVCGKLFTHRASHYTHIRSHLPPSYACERCDYKTWHKHDLVKHVRIHTGVKLYQCEFCTSSFYTSSNLTGHIHRFHEGIKRFQCTMCDRKFYDRTKLNRHLDSHNDIKRYECEICHSCFTRRCYWKKHLQRQHSIEVPAQRPGRQKVNQQVGEYPSNDGIIARLYAESAS